MDQRRKGENKMQREIQQQSRRRPENQMAAQNHHPPAPPQKCPRCDSVNTKFCYYNNYSLSQPRYFCKACRRYWTHGGTLRNVPVGGGCRKSKRPKPSTATSSSSTTEIARAHQAATPPPNLTGMVSGQALRAPILPTMCNNNNNSFYTGGAFLSSLASMQSLPTGINQGPAQNFVAGGNSNGQYDVNMALLQNLQYLRPNQGQIELSASQQSLNLNPVRPVLNSWTQSFIRGSAGAPAAGPSSSFWSRTAVEGENQAGSISFHSNQWTDNNNINNNNNNPGFDPTR